MTAILTLKTSDGTRSIPFTPPFPLHTLLAQNSVAVDMPCGGRRRCLKCRVKITGSLSPMGDRESALLSEEEKAAHIRFACMAELLGNAVLDLSSQAAKDAIVTEGIMPAFSLEPWGTSLGAAVDIGTTTLAAYLFRLKDGALLASCSKKNPQGVYGADVVSRLEASIKGQKAELAETIRGGLAQMLSSLCVQAGRLSAEIDSVVLTGNTAMLYLLTGRDPTSIVAAPFAMDCAFGQFFTPDDLGLPLSPSCRVYLPRCLSAYVGADITTALLAADLFRNGRTVPGPPRLLVDIGTNGEMVLAAKGCLLCCSTAAGPALEGAGIRQGMAAKTGAIHKVQLEGASITCQVLGDGPAEGLCGSGLIDAIAVLRQAGILDETGCIDEESHAFTDCIEEWEGQPAFRFPGTSVLLTQPDIRAVQMAKSAICAGILTLIGEAGLRREDIYELVIAGGFGSRINVDSAERIGLIPSGFAGKSRAIGNAAGTGAAMLLLSRRLVEETESMDAAARTVSLSSHPVFTDAYLSGMYFP